MTYKIAKSHPIAKERKAIDQYAERCDWLRSYCRAAIWYCERHGKPCDHIKNAYGAIMSGCYEVLRIKKDQTGFYILTTKFKHHVTSPWSHP